MFCVYVCVCVCVLVCVPVTGRPVVVGAASTSLLGLLLGQGRRGASPSMTLEPDTDGLFGETPFEAQQQLRPYDAYVWELRRPLDLLMLITFAGTCTTLAPLLPLAALLFLLLKSRLDALELIVMTQRPPVNRERDVEVWTEALSWLGLVAVLATSIDIMFVTPDVEALIARLAASYRVFLVRDPAFSAGTTCVGGVCLDAGGTHKAEGSLYWIIWVCIVGLGLGGRLLAVVGFRLPSLYLLRVEQVCLCVRFSGHLLHVGQVAVC